ncbi:TPA: restriction endonuclease subunit S [Photobacterium damselae]
MTEQMNVPKLRFGEFDDEWKIASLGQLLTVGNGKDYKHLGKGDIPVFGTGGYMLSVDKSLHDGESVFIGRKGSIDKPFYYNGAFWTVDTLFYTKDFKGITPKFTYNLFQRINWKLYNEATGVPSLSKTTIQKIKVDVPSLLEQQKIDSFLSKVDEKIALLTEKKAKLTEYKKGVMQQLFDGKWQEQDGKLVFVPPTLRFKADDGSEFPDWEEKKLGDVATFIDSLHETPKYYVEEGYPMVRVADVKDKGLDINVCLKVTKEVFQHFTKRYAPQLGDIIFSRVGTCGESVQIDFNEKVCLGQNTVLLKPIHNSRFTFYSLKSDGVQNQVQRKVVGSSHKTLSLKDAKNFVFYLPMQAEQDKIADFLTALNKRVNLANSELEKAKEWKKGLLQQMFV